MRGKNLSEKTNFFLQIVLVLLGAAFIMWLSNMIKNIRADFTEKKIYTLSPATKKVLNNLKDIVRIEVFFSKDLPPAAQSDAQDILDKLDNYVSVGNGKIIIQKFDPAKSDAENKARSYGIPEAQLQAFGKDEAIVKKCYFGMAVISPVTGKKEVFPVVNEIGNLEYDLTSKIVKVSTPKEEEKRIGFLFGQGPHSFEKDYSSVRMNLDEIFKGSIQTVDCSRGQKIDEKITTLVVAGPKNLSEREQYEIDQFLMRGGNLIAMIDAVEVNTEEGLFANAANPNYIALFTHYGATVNQNLICSKVNIPITYQINYGNFVLPVQQPYVFWPRIGWDGMDHENPATAPLKSGMVYPWGSSISLVAAKDAKDSNAVKATVLAKTNEKSWTQEGRFDINPQAQPEAPSEDAMNSKNAAVLLQGRFTSYFADKPIPQLESKEMVKDAQGKESEQAVKKPAPGDESRQTLKQMSKPGNIVLVGNSGLLTNNVIRQFGHNMIFFVNVVDWLTMGGELINIRSRNFERRLFDPEKVTETSKFIIRWGNFIGIPLLVALAGLGVFLSRRMRKVKLEDLT